MMDMVVTSILSAAALIASVCTLRAVTKLKSCSSPYPASVLAVTLPAYLMQTSPMVCRENDFAVLDYIDDALHARLNLCAHIG